MKVCDTSDRLKNIMETRNLKQVDILRMSEPYCKKYNIRLNKNGLSQYVSGKVEPGQAKLLILGKALNVNEAWLMGFDVPMTDIPIDNEHSGNNFHTELSEDEKLLLDLFRCVPEDKKKLAIEMIRAALKAQ